jgi:transposase
MRNKQYPEELRQRAIRMVQEQRAEYASEWAAIVSIAGKLGMGTEALRRWIRQAEVDSGTRAGQSTGELQRVRELERENRELRRANDILKAATVFFARELDPQLPPR